MRRQQTGGFLDSAASSAVFLSYASQDADAAQRICDGLRAGGIEVWFDRSELRGGDAWDQKIRQQIRDCALFVAVISANTAARAEGYFRLEWALAEQRAQRMARNRAFILPVCVDATHEGGADVPEAFTRVQWTRLLGGQVPAPFASRVRTLLGLSAASAAPPAATAATPDVATVPAAVAAPAGISPVARRPGPAVLVTLIACALALGVLIWRPWHMPSGHAAAAPQQAPAGGAPTPAAEQSVAVLPFADMSEKHDQEYFSDGLAEELIDALTRVPNLRVPARTSSFSFKGRQVTVGEIARALGVSHVLEGSVRKAGHRVRFTGQLIDATTGGHLWADRFDGALEDVFDLQDQVTAKAVGAIEPRLQRAEIERAGRKPTESLDAYDYFLRGMASFHLFNRDSLLEAARLFVRATELDPNYASPYGMASWSGALRNSYGWMVDREREIADAVRLARRAVAVGKDDPTALWSGGLSLAYLGHEVEAGAPTSTARWF